MVSTKCVIIGSFVLLCLRLCTSHRVLVDLNDQNKPKEDPKGATWSWQVAAVSDDIAPNGIGQGYGSRPVTGSGYGSGFGSGSGSGYGYGSGSGLGYGEGSGSGSGSGYGDDQGIGHDYGACGGCGEGQGMATGHNEPDKW